jgi:hypothetical protein
VKEHCFVAAVIALRAMSVRAATLVEIAVIARNAQWFRVTGHVRNVVDRLRNFHLNRVRAVSTRLSVGIVSVANRGFFHTKRNTSLCEVFLFVR